MRSSRLQALLRQLDFPARRLRIIDAALGRIALGDPEVKLLTTIPGVDATIALSIIAADGMTVRDGDPGRSCCTGVRRVPGQDFRQRNVRGPLEWGMPP